MKAKLAKNVSHGNAAVCVLGEVVDTLKTHNQDLLIGNQNDGYRKFASRYRKMAKIGGSSAVLMTQVLNAFLKSGEGDKDLVKAMGGAITQRALGNWLENFGKPRRPGQCHWCSTYGHFAHDCMVPYRKGPREEDGK
uniref:CCHC-type domain-containing protein n=1 Tax=Plectus sambesii TaxID=2011161 RepID=A0A914WYZ7_9BILA